MGMRPGESEMQLECYAFECEEGCLSSGKVRKRNSVA